MAKESNELLRASRHVTRKHVKRAFFRYRSRTFMTKPMDEEETQKHRNAVREANKMVKEAEEEGTVVFKLKSTKKKAFKIAKRWFWISESARVGRNTMSQKK